MKDWFCIKVTFDYVCSEVWFKAQIYKWWSIDDQFWRGEIIIILIIATVKQCVIF